MPQFVNPLTSVVVGEAGTVKPAGKVTLTKSPAASELTDVKFAVHVVLAPAA